MSVKEHIFVLLCLCQVIALTHELCRDIGTPRLFESTQTSSGSARRALLWNNDTVTVSFVNGDCNQRSSVRMFASEWIPYSNINFVFIDEPYKGDIRVGFYEHFGSSWSMVGIASKHISFDVNTGKYVRGMQGISMNLYSTSQRTILHEFGHALGLKHEHRNPFGGIKWNKTAVIKHYSGPPNNWAARDIEHNVIIYYSRDRTNGVYDPDSIMRYPIEPDVTINKCCGITLNENISKGDKLVIQELYGRFKASRNAAEWAVKWNGIGKSNNPAHSYGQSWRGTSISQTQKAELISKILCEPASEIYAGLLSRPTSQVSAYGTCMVGIVGGMPTFWVQGMYGAVGHSGYPKNPVSKDATGHLRSCYNEHRLTGLCAFSNVPERAKQTLLYAIENDVCTDYPNL